MAWTSELQELANRNRYIDTLQKLGYDIGFVNSHLVVFGVPYLSSSAELKHFDIITTLDLREGYSIDRPTDHKVWITGGVPYNIDGRPVAMNSGAETHVVSEHIVGSLYLSSKPTRGYYESLEEKISQYLSLIVPPALHKFPDATPYRALEARKKEIPSPLKYPDALSARDGVVELSHKLLHLKVGIVGCGGTGAYLLDFLGKTHVAELRLFDDDIVHVHTLFRFPGVFEEEHLGMRKVEVLSERYRRFHEGVFGCPERITESNVDVLSTLDFVFVAVDDGPSRQVICEACHRFGIPFIDVGMGLTKGSAGLFGFVRISGGGVADFPTLNQTQFLPAQNPHDNEYRRQPQISELNALNASMAIIRFKQHFGYFDRLTDAVAQTFDVAAIAIDKFPG